MNEATAPRRRGRGWGPPATARPGRTVRGSRAAASAPRLASLAVLAALALLGSGCATTGVRVAGEQALLLELERRGVERAVAPFALNDEMVSWVAANVAGGERERRLDRLVEAVGDPSLLGVEYETGRTASAVEVFENRTANCLAFTHMFVGMARELGLDAYFVEVSRDGDVVKDGDLVVVSDHVAAAWGPMSARRIVDFGQRRDARVSRVRPISDLRATALHYSNRGAEAVRSEALDDAVSWLRDAVAIDPELVSAWVNLGVALRRSGLADEAEQSYRQALLIEPRASSAALNLAVVLRLQGRQQEADELLLLVDADDRPNPFAYLELGDLSLRHGRLEEAERFYSRARRFDTEKAESVAALGEVRLRQGERRAAEKLLRRARRLEPEGGRRIARLARLLAAS